KTKGQGKTTLTNAMKGLTTKTAEMASLFAKTINLLARETKKLGATTANLPDKQKRSLGRRMPNRATKNLLKRNLEKKTATKPAGGAAKRLLQEKN
ncbi:MAG: hypothetical protein ACO3EE_06110, partial [Flavobacteriales bacterium]